MTAIAGLVHDGHIWMGGDSAASNGWNMTVRSDPKVFFNGEFLIGFTTSFRMGQLLQYAAKLPTPPDTEDLHGFMVTSFVDTIREVFKDSGWGKKEAEQEKGGAFLVGVRGRLFSIESDYQVGESDCGYDAVGGGEDLALGAMHASTWWRAADLRDPRKRIMVALEAAAKHSAGVRAPFTILSTKEMP